MNRKTHGIIYKTFLASLCILSTTLTVWAAGPGEALSETQAAEGTSRVILCGVSTEETTAVAEAPTSEVLPSQIAAPEATPVATGEKGASLGTFTTTGYCNCKKCSGGHNLTYSGTVPKAKHTISADLSKYPIGTKLMLNGVIYTVEDMGSSVKGNWIDVYYASHQEAVNHGMKKEEVFTVE